MKSHLLCAELTFVLILMVIMTMTLPANVYGQSGYSASGSWAIGIVVPENSKLSGGELVKWNSVNNISALFNLPNITTTDGTIYIIMSLMTESGSIMQVAVGLYSNSSYWRGYAMYILNPNSYPQVYTYVKISKNHKMFANDIISISTFVSNDTWHFMIRDLTRGTSISSYFNSSLPVELMEGAQYVLALESYSYNSSVFERTSNITLYGLYINGKKVLGGWYLYTTWNNQNFPLFVVGGATPPNFIGAAFSGNGTVTWSYVKSWATGSVQNNSYYIIAAILVIAAIVNISVLTVLILKRRKY